MTHSNVKYKATLTETERNVQQTEYCKLQLFF